MPRKVFVSGCFDMLHSGHVAFFQAAAALGELHVAVGADRTVFELKGRRPVNTETERVFMVKSVAGVASAFVSSGSGMLDFEPELRRLRPDVFVVNEDGDVPEKQRLCEELGIEYVVLERVPHGELHARSTTALRQVDQMPYRIDLAGGWLDQPWVSKHHPGAVITVSIEPTIEFNERSGMATSTRRKAIELWGNRLPPESLEKLAQILFCCENPPGSAYISGTQDSIGIVYPGLARASYEGAYWPTRIEHCLAGPALDFVERALYLKPLGPRAREYDVLADTRIDAVGARTLSEATDRCWEAIQTQDLPAFGTAVRQSFEAQIAMFPYMVDAEILALIDEYRDQALGWKLAGSGGGGYLVLVADAPIKHAVRIAVRREVS
ncbi:MAG: adenylyltransferase/cytidyltransferase family protein [Candidatus Latescibacterota bacterium]|jgi:cytidyltransferase-like protein